MRRAIPTAYSLPPLHTRIHCLYLQEHFELAPHGLSQYMYQSVLQNGCRPIALFGWQKILQEM
jgi:hypothetical protein